MASSQQTQPKGTLLVTGAGGFVGGNIVLAALKRGYSVRITARSEASAQSTLAHFPSYASQLSSVLVRDITDVEAYAPAFADGAITGILHAASPFVLAPEDNERDLLQPAIKGATAVLEATARFGAGKVRGVVATSSFASVVDIGKGLRPGYAYTEQDWNEMSYDEAKGANGVVAYCASKALAERAMWKWVEERGGEPALGFALTTICPPWVFGPYAWELTTTKGLSESVALFNALFGADAVPPFDFGGFADARVLGFAHVRALEVPEARGQRLLVAQGFRYQTVVDIAREEIPELREKLPVGTPGKVEDAYTIDGSKAERVLGLKYGSLRDTVVETFRQLLKARELEGTK
ncbi:NAD(P)-binding protein [Whalleya microplaca]|nr:NAD(P)-binding protein [Whalleya microplaca]